MAKGTYWQRGEAIDYKNEGSAAIEANTLVVFGEHVGVAGTDIAGGDTGSLLVEGTWEIPKDNAAITAGATVYFDGSAGSATKGSGAVAAGYAVEAAAAGDATVRVKLLG